MKDPIRGLCDRIAELSASAYSKKREQSSNQSIDESDYESSRESGLDYSDDSDFEEVGQEKVAEGQPPNSNNAKISTGKEKSHKGRRSKQSRGKVKGFTGEIKYITEYSHKESDKK